MSERAKAVRLKPTQKLAAVPQPTPSIWSTREDRSTLTLGAAASGIVLSLAVQRGDGMLFNHAETWLAVSVFIALAALIAPKIPLLEKLSAAALPWVIGCGLTWFFVKWGTKYMSLWVVPMAQRDLDEWRRYLIYGAVLSGTALMEPPAWFKRAQVPALLGTFLCMGLWLIAHTPNPHIDVVYELRESIAALLRGDNPYTLTFKNIYGSAENFSPEFVQGDRLLFGYQYPPLNLLFSLPGHFFGDARYSMLAAMIAAAGLIAYVQPGWRATSAAALLLFMPRAMLVLESGWVEPLALTLLVGTMVAARFYPKAIPYTLGLLLADKQYIWCFLGTALLLPQVWDKNKPDWRLIGKVILVAVAINLPFFLWSPTGFWVSLVSSILSHPFRNDGLTFLAWYKQHGGDLLPTWLCVISGVLAGLLVWRRAPRTLAGFAFSFGFVFLMFIVFSRQAFCNYFYLILGAFFAALAAASFPKPALDSTLSGT